MMPRHAPRGLNEGLGIINTQDVVYHTPQFKGKPANRTAEVKAAGLGWPLPSEYDDAALELLLFPPAVTQPERKPIDLPDFPAIHEELRRHKHLTLQLLWQEYKQDAPEGYQYSRYCELYRRWSHKLDLVLRQDVVGIEQTHGLSAAGRKRGVEPRNRAPDNAPPATSGRPGKTGRFRLEVRRSSDAFRAKAGTQERK